MRDYRILRIITFTVILLGVGIRLFFEAIRLKQEMPIVLFYGIIIMFPLGILSALISSWGIYLTDKKKEKEE